MICEAHILIIDDDERISALLKRYLIKNGFLVSAAKDAAHARRLFQSLEFDLIILDIMMPGEDGISLAKFIRQTSKTPILMLSAKGAQEDRIKGLEAGSDDYLPKPFEPKELLLRINAILRRSPPDTPDEIPKVLHMGNVRYDITRGELWKGTQMVRLTSTEIRLMRVFAEQPNVVISRAELVLKLERNKDPSQERATDVQITRLRRKIEENPKQPRYLQTVRGEGYVLKPD